MGWFNHQLENVGVGDGISSFNQSLKFWVAFFFSLSAPGAEKLIVKNFRGFILLGLRGCSFLSDQEIIRYNSKNSPSYVPVITTFGGVFLNS